MRPRVIMLFAAVMILLGGGLLVPAAYGKLTGPDPAGPDPVATTAAARAALVPPPPPTLAPAPVAVPADGFVAWALLDRRSAQITGSPNSAESTNSTESMIKVWIVSDFLRRTAEAGRTPSADRLKQGSAALRYSDDDAAGALYSAGGGTAVTKRMMSMCKLTNTRLGTVPGYVGWWSFTEMTAQDAVRLGECVRNGTAAGPKWTDWVLDEMRNVWGTAAKKDQERTRGGGRWGIIDGLPKELVQSDPVSIKNGWTSLVYDGNWHVNCLAISNNWVLAVQQRYPDKRGLEYGARVCANVAAQLVTPGVGAALRIPRPLTGS
ncbi:hypothetical protein [Micromonospora sp. NBC_01796]|uniref:hypothetical protein n=1 Tax=Micromonospora sp. NBC_01796 TaxID=2975987 RepID=UPI002DDA9417|nr:hypothetical protein [Micromonospora sp. NBC_01796]WSA87571.1 hypothetical protein OIE47_08155 [Micromonospora sp. NBC_01796]